MLASDIFTIVSSALIQTGNNPPVAAYDGTDEWIVGQNAYELWLPYCLESKDWSFQRTTGSLTRVGPASWPGFSDAFAFPATCLHLITVFRTDTQVQTAPPLPSGQSPPDYIWQAPRAGLFPLEYKIVGSTIETNAPNGLSGEWLTVPAGADRYSATFTAALIAYVASSIYASLNEDLESAEKTFQVAEGLLDRAAVRLAEQQNRRVPFLASTFAADPFTVISSALIQTGRQPPVTSWDGTDDWIAGWNAYQVWLPYCLESKDWSFQRQTGILTRTGAATWLGFTDAFAFPANCLHLITVFRTDTEVQTTPPPPAGEAPPDYVWQATRSSLFPLEYKIMGSTIETNAPNGLSAEWLSVPAGSDRYSASFNLALIAYVASALHKDPAVAEKMFQAAEGLLDKAALRVAQQQNRRVPFLAATLAADPFTIISSALIRVGRQPPITSWDGTDDWIDGWNAYQLWLPYCLEARDWNFQTIITASLTRVGNASYPRFADAFAIPANCIHLQTVWRPDLAAQQYPYLGWGMMSPGESVHPPQIEYRIIGSTIETTAPQGLAAKYFTNPSNANTYTASFNLALTAFVASALVKDLAASEKMLAEARNLLQEAATRSDQQENRRVAFRSRMVERRRARYAPWGTTT